MTWQSETPRTETTAARVLLKSSDHRHRLLEVVMHTSRLALFAAPAVLLFTACETTAPRPMARLSLSAGIGASAVHATPSGPAMDVIVTGSGGSVKITSAQIMLSDLRLKGAACAGTEGDDADSSEAGDSAEAADTGEAADSAHEGPDTNEV